jgi:Iap family predicted aminopeptidase
MTVIEISPYKWGWRVFEAPGVEPVFLQKEQAIAYAQGACAISLRRDSCFGFDRQA